MTASESIEKETFSARDVLLYLRAEAKEWNEDVDGDISDGVTRVYINHDIRITEGLLEELLDMAGISKAWDESCIQALDRENDADFEASEKAHGEDRSHEGK
jgi:hypothetical protein